MLTFNMISAAAFSYSGTCQSLNPTGVLTPSLLNPGCTAKRAHTHPAWGAGGQEEGGQHGADCVPACHRHMPPCNRGWCPHDGAALHSGRDHGEAITILSTVVPVTKMINTHWMKESCKWCWLLPLVVSRLLPLMQMTNFVICTEWHSSTECFPRHIWHTNLPS